jgi:hypothetical protein
MPIYLCYIHSALSFHVFFPLALQPNLGLGLPPWNSPCHFGFLDLRQSVGLRGRVISLSQGRYLHTNTINIHALSGIGTHDPGFRVSEDSAFPRTLGYRDRHRFTFSYAKWLSASSGHLMLLSWIIFAHSKERDWTLVVFLNFPSDIFCYVSFNTHISTRWGC